MIKLREGGRGAERGWRGGVRWVGGGEEGMDGRKREGHDAKIVGTPQCRLERLSVAKNQTKEQEYRAPKARSRESLGHQCVRVGKGECALFRTIHWSSLSPSRPRRGGRRRSLSARAAAAGAVARRARRHVAGPLPHARPQPSLVSNRRGFVRACSRWKVRIGVEEMSQLERRPALSIIPTRNSRILAVQNL
jgi:hypothetical protein